MTAPIEYNPDAPGGTISVTLKADEPGGKYNDAKSPGSWIVLHGTPAQVKAQLIEVFALDAAQVDAPLFDLVNECTRLFKASASVTNTLGGRVVRPGSEQAASAPATSGGAFAAAAATPGPSAAEKAKASLLEQVEAAPTVTALKTLWAKNQDAFKDPDLEKAYMTKGPALKAAGLL